MKIILMLFGFITVMIIQDLQAQEKIDVTYEAGDGKVYINYFLHGDPGQEYNLSAVLRKSSDPVFRLIPKEVSGDVGKGRFAGKKCTITWMVNQDEEKALTGEDFYFEVTADEVSQGSSWYWYVLGAAVAGGGAATYLLLNKNKNETTQATPDIAVPPGRP